MKLVKTLAKFSVGTWIQAGLALVTTPIIAWYINPDEFGKSSMFTLAYNLLLNIVLLAQDQGFARFYNETSNKPVLLRAAMIPVVGTTFICLVVIEFCKPWLAPILYSSTDTSHVYLLSLSLITGIILRMSTMAIRMQGSALVFSIIQVIQAIVNFLAVIIYAKFFNNTFEAILIGVIASQFTGSIIAIIFDYKLWRGIFHSTNESLQHIKPVLTYSLPFVPTFLLSWVFQGIDKAFLRSFSNFAELGLYATAAKIAFSLNIIQTGFTTFWFPFSLDKFKHQPDDTGLYNVVFNVLCFTFGVIIFLIILFQKLILMVLPKAYEQVIAIFPLLLLIPMLYTLSEVTVVGVTFMKKTHQHMYVTVVACATNALLAYICIPKYGAVGASFAMMVGYFVFFALRTYYGRKNYPFPIEVGKFILLIGLIMSAITLSILASPFYYAICILGIIVTGILYWKDLYKITKF